MIIFFTINIYFHQEHLFDPTTFFSEFFQKLFYGQIKANFILNHTWVKFHLIIYPPPHFYVKMGGGVIFLDKTMNFWDMVPQILFGKILELSGAPRNISAKYRPIPADFLVLNFKKSPKLAIFKQNLKTFCSKSNSKPKSTENHQN